MPELSRPQLRNWESTLQMAAGALDDPRGGAARFQARLRGTMIGLREAVEALKRMAEAQEIAQRQQAETRRHLDCLLEHLPIPYVLTTVDGGIVAANDAAGAALNVTSRVLVGRNLLMFMDDRESLLQALRETATSGFPFRRVCNLRPRERRPDRVLASVSAVVPGGGDTVQWFLIGGAAETLLETGMARALGRRHARAS